MICIYFLRCYVLTFFFLFFLESSKDYLETKKRILDLREKFGENNWLSSHAGTFVQDIMGLRSASQLPKSQISKIQTLADIDKASSLHDTLIHVMDNEESSDESESQEITEYAEDNKEIPQSETLDNFPETRVAPTIEYDPNDGITWMRYIKRCN